MPINNQGMLYPVQPLPPPTPQQQMEEENWELIFINAMSGAPGASLLDLIDQCPLDKLLPLQGRLLIAPSLILGLVAQVRSSHCFPLTMLTPYSLSFLLTLPMVIKLKTRRPVCGGYCAVRK